jgi:mono/diheme cytochrome c family protein
MHDVRFMSNIAQRGSLKGRHIGTMKLIPIVIFASFALTSASIAQESGNAKKGANLAQTVCAQCHAVGPGLNRSPNPMAPAFAGVAGWPGMTDRALRVWLQSSHPTMPTFVLSRTERNDLVAYILSLWSASSPM